MGKIMKDNMIDEERLPDTLTPKERVVSSQPENDVLQMPWGRLIACKQFVKCLESVDLVESFSFGRSEQCSMVITAQSCPVNILLNISKVHFRIERNTDDSLVYITDLSKNGTFVNRDKLGTGNKKILKNDDTIAIALPRNSVYVFRCFQDIDEFLPTALIPKYANIRRLGRGSCGEVRLIKDRDTFIQYAVKKIVLGESNTSQLHKINHPTKIQNEIEILRKLKHPCIIKCEDIIQCDREIYLILEFMAGGELTKRVVDFPMTEDNVKFYFLQMLCAVQYLHSNNIIHRDLKPENILLLDQRQETVLKITDFGLSKITSASDMTSMCGTLRYVAPEVINNSFREYGEYGKKVDVWSLGVILFFMISRDFPFKGEEQISLAQNIVKCKFDMTGEVWSRVSAELIDLIQRILVVKPKRRSSIYQIMTHPWVKTDYGVEFRLKNLLKQEGLENPMDEIQIEPPEKKFKFDNNLYSSSNSSDELENTLVYSDGSSSYSSGPTMCY